MRLIIIVIAILCASSGRAQDRFFTFVNGWTCNMSFERLGEYHVIGLNGLDSPTEHEIFLSSLNDSGNTLIQEFYSIDTVLSTSLMSESQALMSYNDSTLWVAGYTGNGGGQTEGAWYSYDQNYHEFDLLHSYYGDELIQFTHIIPFSDTTVVVAARWSNGNTSSRLYCLHHDGTVLWSTDFVAGPVAHRTYPKGIVRLESGEIAALFWEHDVNQPTFHDRWRTRLSLLNDTGAVLWTRYPGDHENYRIRPGGITEQDGDILVAFSDPEYYDEDGEWQGNPNNRVRFERYDVPGTLLEQDSLLDNTAPFSVKRTVTQLSKLNDGNYLISGNHELRHGFLAKITPAYETIWFERYSPYEYVEGEFPDFSTQILNTIETSDGGFLCTGMFQADPGSEPHPAGLQTAIALKVDEYGCLVENCFVGLEELTNSRLEIYPNPAQDVINIEVDNEFVPRIIQLTNALGDIVLERNFEQVFNISRLESGLYILQIVNAEGQRLTKKLMVE